MNFQAVGFVFILALVGLGVDYHQQTLKSELELGELSAGAYVSTISSRFGDAQAAKQAKIDEKARKSRVRAGARPYLPEAPEGWTRRELAAGDNSRITPPKRELSEDEKKLLESNALLRNLSANSEKQAAETRNAQTWVYERGDEILSIRAQFTELPKGKSISSTAMTMIAGNLEGMAIMDGWGVIHGVAFGTYTSYLREQPKEYRTITAIMGFGSEVRLTVNTNTTDEATREILNRIDYDGLNALLPRPLGHVGSNAAEVPLALQVEAAEQIMEIRADLIQKRTAAAENWLRSATSPEDAMTLALRQTGIGVTGSMGDHDDELDQVMDTLQTRAEQPVTPASDDQEADAGRLFDAVSGIFNSAKAKIAGDAPASSSSSGKVFVSKPLSEERIQKLEAMSAPERRMALAGLDVSVRNFEAKHNRPKGSCSFSMMAYRVECDETVTAAADPEPQETSTPKDPPKRLKLSGGKSCLDNSIGSLCKK